MLALRSVHTAFAATDKAYLIVPGARVGHLHLGRDGAAQLSKMVTPTAEDASSGRASMVWVSKTNTSSPPNTLFAETRVNGQLNVRPIRSITLKVIRVTSPFFRTRKGISTLSTLARVKKAFPRIKRLSAAVVVGNTAIYTETRQGIAFEFARDTAAARCIAITVYLPRLTSLTRGYQTGKSEIVSRDYVARFIRETTPVSTDHHSTK